MTMLMDMKMRILHAIAIHTPFPLSEIEAAHDRLGSYDATIAATIIASEHNIPLRDIDPALQGLRRPMTSEEVDRSVT